MSYPLRQNFPRYEQATDILPCNIGTGTGRGSLPDERQPAAAARPEAAPVGPAARGKRFHFGSTGGSEPTAFFKTRFPEDPGFELGFWLSTV